MDSELENGTEPSSEHSDERALEPDVEFAIRESLSGSDSWFTVYSRLRDRVPEGQEERYRASIWAFGYMLISPEQTEWREREGAPFGAMFEFEGGRLPPRLSDVPSEDVAVWDAACDAIDDPRSRARLGDLLWERKE